MQTPVMVKYIVGGFWGRRGKGEGFLSFGRWGGGEILDTFVLG